MLITKTKSNEKGQALLFVVVAMTIALSIGINASVRTIRSISRSTRTDTASRALAAAEGGIERYLSLGPEELEEAIEGNCAVGTYSQEQEACLITFDLGYQHNQSEVITSQAYVTVTRFKPTSFTMHVESGEVKEINLYDYDTNTYYNSSQIRLCWDYVDSSQATEITYLSYNSDGVQENGGLRSSTASVGNGYTSEGFEVADSSNADFSLCKDVEIGTDIDGLRIRSLGGASNIGVYSLDGVQALPIQGYLVTSTGRIAQDEQITASRTIEIIITLPYLPASFDHGFYTPGGINKN